MTTKPVTGYTIKDGKLVRKTTFRAAIKRHKAARTIKAWKATSTKRSGQSSP